MAALRVALPLAVLPLAVLALAGCAAPHHAAAPPPRTAATPTAGASSGVDGCVEPGDGTVIDLAEGPGTTIHALIMGTGGRGVVLTPELYGSICQWLTFGRELAAAGYHVLIWDSGFDPLAEITTFTGDLRAAGARHVVLAGASNGANISVVATTTLRPAVDGVVWLSGETTMAQPGKLGRDVEPVARTMTVPALFIASTGDPFNAAATGRRFAAYHHNRYVELPGTDHGVELLAGTHRDEVRAEVLAFLHGHTDGGS